MDDQPMSDLQTLLDDHEIRHLAFRYCRALDTKDWALLDDVFVPDATAQLGSPAVLEGIEAIRTRIRTALEHLDESQHLVGNHEIAVDGDTGTHRCYLQAQHIRAAADGGPNWMVAGRYEDRLVRTDAGWRIAHRTLTVMWTDGNVGVAHPG
jgi:ketosteroid isomerase-like protein